MQKRKRVHNGLGRCHMQPEKRKGINSPIQMGFVLQLLEVVFLEANSHSSVVTVEIPMEINKLTNLQCLILADNTIERFPMNLGLLQSLKVATFDGNRITNLPDELGQLVKLERLFVSANLLTSLPDTIGSLRSLGWKRKALKLFDFNEQLLLLTAKNVLRPFYNSSWNC